VLLLDEPAAGLEGRERTRVDDFIEHVRGRLGCSVLIVEHDLDLIRRLCPRIIVLDAGHVLAEGPPAEVLSRADVIDAYVGATEDEAA
jgi:branched-chain amino acid transport system ATP-binding protein